MMENPSEWNSAVRCIADNIAQYHKAMEVGTVGYSLPYFLYLALRENGHLPRRALIPNVSVKEADKYAALGECEHGVISPNRRRYCSTCRDNAAAHF